MFRSSKKWILLKRRFYSSVLISSTLLSSTFSTAQIIDTSKLPTTVKIPAGKYQMGTPESEEGRRSDEGPQHDVTIQKPFYVGATEVTHAQYGYFIEHTGYKPVNKCLTNENGWNIVEGRTWKTPGFEQNENEPVVCVNWQDAQAYVQWLSKITEDEWRLPSESEWEYVARAGTKGRFSNDGTDKELCEVAYAANSTICPAVYKWLAPVGQLAPNQFGLYDVHGNVWEWTEDCYHSTYKGAPTNESAWTTTCESVAAQGQIRENLRVIRGGSAFAPPSFVRSGLRSWSEENTGHINVGFRVVRELNR